MPSPKDMSPVVFIGAIPFNLTSLMAVGVVRKNTYTRALPLTRGSSQRCWMIVPGDNTLKLPDLLLLMINYSMIIGDLARICSGSTCFYKNGNISLIYGPILKN